MENTGKAAGRAGRGAVGRRTGEWAPPGVSGD